MTVTEAHKKWQKMYGYDAVDWDDVINDGMAATGQTLYENDLLPYIDDNPLVQLTKTQIIFY